MDGLSAAASIIAVIQISAEIGSLCRRYANAVKNAKSDIGLLLEELEMLNIVLEGAQKLLTGPNGKSLETSQRLLTVLNEGSAKLESVQNKLKENMNGDKEQGEMSRFGLRAILWPLKSKEFNNTLQMLKAFRDTLSRSLEIDYIALFLSQLSHEEILKILTWISPVRYRQHHNRIKEARTPGTCGWLVQHNRFLEWANSSSSMMLWLQGSPGAGKTFLVSMAIDHTQNELRSSLEEEGFAFFYCNRHEEERRKPLPVLQSFVRQLSTSLKFPNQIRKNLRDMYREKTLDGADLSISDCREQLLEAVNIFTKTTLILDALDECDPDSRAQIIDIIEYLLSTSKKPLKIFISSRPDRDIRNRFFENLNIEIQASHNENDIRKFIDEKIVTHGSWEDFSQPLREEIKTVFLTRSDGMFQWVYLQIKQLLELETTSAIRERLGKLPDGLEATYDEIYGKIKARNRYDKAIANRAFAWIMCACKPLKSEELLSAISLDLNEDAMELSEMVTDSKLLHLCNNLLVLDSQLHVWRFSHLSVVEYLENHLNLQQAHCLVAKSCLSLLIEAYKRPESNGSSQSLESVHKSNYESSDLKAPDGDSIIQQANNNNTCDLFGAHHPLQLYCRQHWAVHIQRLEGQQSDPILADLLKRFLGSPMKSSPAYRNWHSHVDKYERNLKSAQTSTMDLEQIYIDDISPGDATIFAMARLSLYHIISDWWSHAEIEISCRNQNDENLLALSAAAGCVPICRAFLSRGIQVNTQSGIDGSALAAAVNFLNKETAQFLLEQGADVNMQLQCGNYGSALAAAAAAAAKHENIEAMQLLIENKADVNMLLQFGDYGSALAAAAAPRYGNIKAMQLLIQKGADVNMLLQSGIYGSALSAAVAAGYKNSKAVQLLIQHGAKVDMQLKCGNYGSALAAAATIRNTKGMQLLIQQGADVNMLLQSGDYGSALAAAAAARYGNIKALQLLIQQGAKVNMLLRSGNYGSALAAAAAFQNTKAMHLLIQHGADANMDLQVGKFGTALIAAAYWGDMACVKCLLEAGAKANQRAENGLYGTALQAARAVLSDEDESWIKWQRPSTKRGKLAQEKSEVAQFLLDHTNKRES